LTGVAATATRFAALTSISHRLCSPPGERQNRRRNAPSIATTSPTAQASALRRVRADQATQSTTSKVGP
jgi:hypothetical protein